MGIEKKKMILMANITPQMDWEKIYEDIPSYSAKDHFSGHFFFAFPQSFTFPIRHPYLLLFIAIYFFLSKWIDTFIYNLHYIEGMQIGSHALSIDKSKKTST